MREETTARDTDIDVTAEQRGEQLGATLIGHGPELKPFGLGNFIGNKFLHRRYQAEGDLALRLGECQELLPIAIRRFLACEDGKFEIGQPCDVFEVIEPVVDLLVLRAERHIVVDDHAQRVAVGCLVLEQPGTNRTAATTRLARNDNRLAQLALEWFGEDFGKRVDRAAGPRSDPQVDWFGWIFGLCRYRKCHHHHRDGGRNHRRFCEQFSCHHFPPSGTIRAPDVGVDEHVRGFRSIRAGREVGKHHAYHRSRCHADRGGHRKPTQDNDMNQETAKTGGLK